MVNAVDTPYKLNQLKKTVQNLIDHLCDVENSTQAIALTLKHGGYGIITLKHCWMVECWGRHQTDGWEWN